MKEKNPNWGGRRPGAGRPREYIIKKVPVIHGQATYYTEPFLLSPEYESDPTMIVIAQNDDERYGIYIDDDWYGASQALRILEYLQEHRNWLEEKAESQAAEE